MLGGENIHPQPDIRDDFFDFTLISTTQFNFIDIFTAEIVCDSDKYTFWKVERYIDNNLDTTFYFYTNRVISFLKNAFSLELVLDVYLTYTRKVINNMNVIPWINRGSITPNMFNDTTYKPAFLKALKDPEQNVLGGNDGYRNSEIFNLLAEGKHNNVSDSYFPFTVKNLIYKNSKDLPLLVNKYYTPNEINSGFSNSVTSTVATFKVVKNGQTIPNTLYTINYNRSGSNWMEGINSNLNAYKEVDRLLKSSITIDAITKADNPNTWDQINQNMMHGYFAVFFHPDGWIDAYPLLGEVVARINTPYFKIIDRSNTTQITGSVTSEWIWDTRATSTTTLYNDFESIRKDYIDFVNGNNNSGGYTKQSFQGIYRWIYPLGEHSQIQFSFSGNNKDLEIVSGKATLRRFFYRFNYNDALGFNLIDGVTLNKFKLFHNTPNIINDYVNLLQPIVISGNEIIPAKYSFLAQQDTNGYSFSIPLTTSFTAGFKLYCATYLYNNPTLITDLGSTLPTVNGEYFQTLREIERQKNAGVASAIGNIFARPLNWLSTGISGGFTGQKSELSSNTTAWNKTVKYTHKGNLAKRQPYPTESNTRNSGWNRTDTNTNQSTWGANVGGLGGFIGDFINIHNTIKQSEVAKRNIGIGYMTSTDTDMYSAITHNAFVKDNSITDTYYPLKKGIYSIAYRKLFDQATMNKYIYYYTNWGFPIDDFVGNQYIPNLLTYVNTTNNVGFVSFDRNWCLTHLTQLNQYNDNVVRNAIIDQLTEGVRMKRYS